MPFATDRKDKMFTAKNLNNLYSRFDKKCSQALNGMSPLFANSTDGPWEGKYPYGVWYVYRNDANSCKRLRADNPVGPNYIPGIGGEWIDNYQQINAGIQLSTLENQYVDKEGGQVYVVMSYQCDMSMMGIFSVGMLNLLFMGGVSEKGMSERRKGCVTFFVNFPTVDRRDRDGRENSARMSLFPTT